MPDALDLLKTRRSVKPIEMTGPAPSPAEIDTLLTVASRVPDHGKLTPWRFIVFQDDARLKIGETIAESFRANNPQATADQPHCDARSRVGTAVMESSAFGAVGPLAGAHPMRTAVSNAKRTPAR